MTNDGVTIEEKALTSMLAALDFVVFMDWSDNDKDAVDAMQKLRDARDDYYVVQRIKNG